MTAKNLVPASEMLARHEDHLAKYRPVFSGDIQDDFAKHFANSKVITNQFHHAKRLASQKIDALFTAKFNEQAFTSEDLLVYYWPKSKDEAVFQLIQLLSSMQIGSECLIVGENRSGVRSVEKLLADYLQLQKIDTAKRCSLFYGKVIKVPDFDLDKFWHQYNLGSHTLKTLPGIFSYKQLDAGSELLLQSYTQPKENHSNGAHKHILQGNILDLCCGNGVLALNLEVFFAQHDIEKVANKTRHWTLADTNAHALQSAEATFLANNQPIPDIVASDLFNQLPQKFDHIITNPPFHDGQQTDYSITERLIREAFTHLNLQGTLRLVANGFLPYEQIMQDTFGNVECILKTTRFSVYESVKYR